MHVTIPRVASLDDANCDETRLTVIVKKFVLIGLFSPTLLAKPSFSLHARIKDALLAG